MAQSDGIDVVALPRQGGKTTALIERMKADPDLVYVTFSHQAAYHAWRQAGSVPGERQRYITLRHLEDLRFRSGVGAEMPRLRIVVDEALTTLQAALGVEVAAVAFSLEEDSV